MEVIEAHDVIMSVEVIEATGVFKTPLCIQINKLVASITLSLFFENKEKIYLNYGILSEIPPSFKTEAVEDRDINSNQM